MLFFDVMRKKLQERFFRPERHSELYQISKAEIFANLNAVNYFRRKFNLRFLSGF